MKFSDLSFEEKKAFAMFLLMELRRHKEDIEDIHKDLLTMEIEYGINIKEIKTKLYDWIEVDKKV